jgi:hypothetical protein
MAKSKQVDALFFALDDGPDRDKPQMGDGYLVRAEHNGTTFKVIGWRWDTVKGQFILRLEERKVAEEGPRETVGSGSHTGTTEGGDLR